MNKFSFLHRLKKLSHRLACCNGASILFLAFITQQCSLFADYLSLKGTLVVKSSLPDGKSPPNVPDNHLKFDILLAESQWLLRVHYSSSKIISELYGFNGDIYKATYSSPPKRADPNDEPYDPDTYPLVGTVSPGQYPTKQIPAIVVPWLAFCSSRYFQELAGKSMPMPSYCADYEVEAHICDAEVQFLSNHLKLPSKILYTTTSERLKNAPRHPMLRNEIQSDSEMSRRFKDYESIYPPGINLGEYKVLSTTNINDVVIPIEFVYRKNALNKESNILKNKKKHLDVEFEGSSTYTAITYHGAIEHVEHKSGQFDQPIFGKNVGVTDFRLNDKGLNIDYAQYYISNKVWRTEIDEEMSVLLEERRVVARKKRRELLVKRIAIMIAMVGVALTPVLIYARRRKKTNRTAVA
jgi:hypothetical protein